MDDQSGSRSTVRGVVQDVVAEVAPEELPVLAGLLRLSDDEALRRLTRRRRRSDPLGFGLDAVATLVTAIVWVAVQEAVKQTVQGGAARLSRGVGSKWTRLFRRPPAPTVLPPLTQHQLAQIHQRVLELARQNGMKADRATVLADRLLARLALDDSAERGSEQR